MPEAPPASLLPEDVESSGWYWLKSPFQQRPVIGFFVSALHAPRGEPGWTLNGRWYEAGELALRSWRIVGRCLPPGAA
jgi:hypothetical protein